MSYTTIKAVWPGERVADVEELPNSHGSAPIVWGEMVGRYLGEDRWSFFLPSVTKRLWPLWQRPDIPLAQRAVLAMTYDNAYVAKAHYARAAADIRAFLAAFPQPRHQVNHWPRIAALFEADPAYPALGFHWTSVTEDPFRGPWDEAAGDYAAPDWSQYWELYAELDGQAGVAA